MYKLNYVHSPDCEDREEELKEVLLSQSARVIPLIWEQFLKEYILGVGDAYEMFRTYCKAFDIDVMLDTRMIVLHPDGAEDFKDFLVVKNMVAQHIGDKNIILNTIIKDFLLIITTVIDRREIVSSIEKIRSAVKSNCSYSISAIYSTVSHLSAAPSSYARLTKYIGYYFYSGSDVTLYENNLRMSRTDVVLSPDFTAVEHAVNSGDRNKLASVFSSFFDDIENAMPSPAVAKAYCIELYVFLVRGCSADRVSKYMDGIVTLQKAVYFKEIKDFIEKTGIEIAEMNAPAAVKVYSSLIRETINIIDENIENENLSLRWLAGTILYTNVDYLGKLFKKETGKNFSHYVMEKRMEMAKKLILEGKKDRIYEVAEKVGYGSNSQYFSQVFKKYTGVSPLEYREFARLEREKTR